MITTYRASFLHGFAASPRLTRAVPWQAMIGDNTIHTNSMACILCEQAPLLQLPAVDEPKNVLNDVYVDNVYFFFQLLLAFSGGFCFTGKTLSFLENTNDLQKLISYLLCLHGSQSSTFSFFGFLFLTLSVYELCRCGQTDKTLPAISSARRWASSTAYNHQT